MKRIMIAAAAAVVFSAPAMAQNSGSMGSNGTSDNMSPMVDASSAKIESGKITGVTAQIDRPGYLVIHDKGKGAPPASLGHIALDPGTNRDINVNADSALDPSNGITLMLHYETNGNKTYDFGPGHTDVDTPVKIGEQVINEPVKGAM